MATELVTQQDAAVPVDVGFHTNQGFELMQRMAKLLAASQLVPKEFQGNIANTVIALEMAKRMNASPLAVMQNLYIVHGKPSWSSTFIIAAVNSTEKFSPLRFRMTGTEGKDDRTCVAWAVEKATGETLESPPISIAMAKAEGWYARNGSKWQTMPELMLRYRCATLFGRLYAPEVLMGMATVEEAIDITPEAPPAAGAGNGSRSDALAERLRQDSKPGNGSEPIETGNDTPDSLRAEIKQLMSAVDQVRGEGTADKAFTTVCSDAMTLDELEEPQLVELQRFLRPLTKPVAKKNGKPAGAEDLF